MAYKVKRGGATYGLKNNVQRQWEAEVKFKDGPFNDTNVFSSSNNESSVDDDKSHNSSDKSHNSSDECTK